MTEPTTEEDAEVAATRVPRRRWVAIIGAASLLIGAVSAGFVWARSGEEFPRRDPHFAFTLPPLDANKPEFSIAVPITDKGKDIEILEFKARTSPNVEYIGSVAVWPRDLDVTQGQPGVLPGYPTGTLGHHPADMVVPAAELLFEPKGFGAPGDLFVQAGYRLTSGDVGGVLGVKVRWKTGGKTKSQYYSWGVVVCAHDNRCGGTGDDKDLPGDRDFDERMFVKLGLVPANEYD